MEYDEKMEKVAKRMYQAHDLPISWEAIEEEQLDPEVEKAIHDALNRSRRVRGGNFCFRFGLFSHMHHYFSPFSPPPLQQ